MAHPAVETAVEARLRAHWGDRSPIFLRNTAATTPADGSPYLVLQFPVATDRRFALGQRFHEQEGAFRIVMHLATGTGTDRFRQWGEDIASIFRGVKFDGVQCTAPQSPFIDEGDKGPYAWAAIVVPFRFFYSA